MSPKTAPIIVIIATSFSRTNLLLTRSLKSVYQQTNVRPHQIYIVDDNTVEKNKTHSKEYRKIKFGIDKLRNDILKPKFEELKKQKKYCDTKFDSFFHTTLLTNKRTKKFSGTGAWNTAAFKALQYKDKRYFLAFLDDDDSWQHNYLTEVYQNTIPDTQTKNTSVVAVITGFNRIENKKNIVIKPNENKFTKGNLFIKNQGLQGSNLFIELKTFWSIGGFDESLKSTTDRDISIRLIEYTEAKPSKKIKFIDSVLMDHYAIADNCVTRNNQYKWHGLDNFYRKYSVQFPHLQEESLNRAKRLFNYDYSDQVKHPLSIAEGLIKPSHKPKKFNLIIGVISNNHITLKALLKSFLALYKKQKKMLDDYCFLLLDNAVDEYELTPIINYFQQEKTIKITAIKNTAKQTIADNRTKLQKEMYLIGGKLFNHKCVSWIVDDDCLFDTQSQIEYFLTIAQYNNAKIDALFGGVSDAPPLPFLSTLRTQLIDFYYNLIYFENAKPDEEFKTPNNEMHDEYYYDLSNSNFKHLEYPHYYHSQEKINKNVFKLFLQQTILLADGVNVFRKITFEAKNLGKITTESIYRGGNTIIFNQKLLKIPNYTPKNDTYNRRSDFNWAIINKYLANRKLFEIVLPLKHDRTLQKTSLISNKNKLEADIKGLIFYRIFEEILSKNYQEKNIKSTKRYYKKIQKDILLKIKVNNDRTQLLLLLILNKLDNYKAWWFDNAYRKDINHLVQHNINIIKILLYELGEQKFESMLEKLENELKLDDNFFNNIFNDINDIKNTIN